MRPALRRVTDADRPFLARLFRATHLEEFAGLDDSAAAHILELQYRARAAAWSERHDSVDDRLVVEGDEPVGRFWVDRSPSRWELVDVALLPEHQRRGIATNLLEDLVRSASATSVPIHLDVRADNVGALRLYVRCGFVIEHADSMDLRLVWQPGGGTDGATP